MNYLAPIKWKRKSRQTSSVGTTHKLGTWFWKSKNKAFSIWIWSLDPVGFFFCNVAVYVPLNKTFQNLPCKTCSNNISNLANLFWIFIASNVMAIVLYGYSKCPVYWLEKQFWIRTVNNIAIIQVILCAIIPLWMVDLNRLRRRFLEIDQDNKFHLKSFRSIYS